MRALAIEPGGVVIDGTYGRGGHAEEIMKRLGQSGYLLALDRDPEAVRMARQKLLDSPHAQVEKSTFSMLGELSDRHALTGRVTAVLFDLGVSSPQLEDPQRGFSFRHTGPLDMRMDPTSGETAAKWLNRVDEVELARIIYEYGEERYSRRIARAIVQRRKVNPIATTSELADIVKRAVPTRERSKDPATRTFQALRLHINKELEELALGLPQAVRVLAPGGRLAVISFHSLEDRLTKQFFRAEAKGPVLPPDLPLRAVDFRPRLRVIAKPQRPTDAEIKRNPRARSAILRVAERTDVPYA